MMNNLLFTTEKSVTYYYCNNNSTEQIAVTFDFISTNGKHYEKTEVLEKARAYSGVDRFAKENLDMFACAFNEGYASELCEVYSDIDRYISWNELLRTAKNVKSRNEMKRRWTKIYELFKLYKDLLWLLYGDKRTFSMADALNIARNNKRIYQLYNNNYDVFNYLRLRNKLPELYEEYTRKEWTDEEVIEHASHYERYIDFLICEEFAYEHALFYDLFDDKIKHLVGKLMGNSFWNKERIIKFCTKFNTKGDFYNKFPGVSVACNRYGWREECINLETVSRKKTFTYDECLSMAKQCENKSQMQHKFGCAYKFAVEHNWVEDYVWFYKNDIYFNVKDYCIYLNISDELNFAYVGLTRIHRFNIRHTEHKSSNDALSTFCKQNNIEIPKPILLEKDLTPDEAVYYETYYWNEYKNKGYNVLNVVKPGSLGGSVIKWHEEDCYNEALKYTKYIDFVNKSPGAAQRARDRGWIKNYTWLERRDHIEHTLEGVLAEASKYEYLGEFKNNAKNYYDAACRHGWMDEVRKILKNRSEELSKDLNFEGCLEKAKLCKNSRQFNDDYPSYYNYSVKNDYIIHFYWFYKPEKYWTYDKCRDEFLKYKTVEEFEENCYGGYHVSLEKGWLEDYKNGLYYEYKAKRIIYPKNSDYNFNIMYALTNIDKASDDEVFSSIINKNIFTSSQIDINNKTISMMGDEYSKYADCSKYFYKGDMYLIKKDFKKEYSDCMTFLYIKQLIDRNTLHPFPLVNDYDTVDIEKIQSIIN